MLKKLLKDKYCFMCLIFAVICGGFSVALLQDPAYHTLSLARIIFCCCLIPAILIFRSDGLFFTFFIYGQVLVYLHDYTDYISFIITAIFALHYARLRYPALAVYLVNTIIIAELHDKNASHLIVHIAGCIAIYFALITFVLKKMDRKPLDLTERETEILKQLAAGKMQKEITYPSKNTITQDIKNAMNRNNCATKEELLSIFIQQSK